MEAEELVYERDLVERARHDDRAFTELYQRYFPEMYAFMVKRLGQREKAEDLVSELFLKLCQNLQKYQPQACSFRSWFYRVATNLLIDYTRKSSVKYERTVEEFPEIEDPKLDETERYARSEEGKMVRKVLATIPMRYQQLLELKFFSELSNNEIAETLGETANNVGVLIHRALKKFEEAYQARV
jgi:RNA polymerase sigma-70 factor (ECF subfamily)